MANLKHGFELNFLYNIYSGRLTQLLCLFILGMQLGRQRLFYNEERHLHGWHVALCVSSVLVVAFSIMDSESVTLWLKPVCNLMILLMIVSTIVSAWYAFDGVRRALRPLCCFGRMSLTNYLLQSVVGSFIFCGYGLCFYNKVGITYAVMIGVAMVAVQYVFCRYWFSSHQRGPLEELWRKLTWLKAGNES